MVPHIIKFNCVYWNEILVANLESSHQVGHSIGSHISIEMFKKSPEKVIGALHICTCTHDGTYPSLLILANCLLASLLGSAGEILHWTLSIFDIKPTVSSTVSYWKDFRVSLIPSQSHPLTFSSPPKVTLWRCLLC